MTNALGTKRRQALHVRPGAGPWTSRAGVDPVRLPHEFPTLVTGRSGPHMLKPAAAR